MCHVVLLLCTSRVSPEDGSLFGVELVIDSQCYATYWFDDVQDNIKYHETQLFHTYSEIHLILCSAP